MLGSIPPLPASATGGYLQAQQGVAVRFGAPNQRFVT